MIATAVNAALVLIGSVVGLTLRNRIKEKYARAIMSGLALCVMLIGGLSAAGTKDILCVIICMAVGTVIGELLKIEDRLDSLGDVIKAKVMRGREAGRFAEGFMTATLLFCVGSMSVMGSMEAGINHNYSIIFSKSVIDCISAVTLAAALGVGVCFSSLGVLAYQGLLTLLFILAGPFMPEAVVTEMTSVGGLVIIAIGINMLGLGKERIHCGNMLPAIFLPVVYIPLSELITAIF